MDLFPIVPVLSSMHRLDPQIVETHRFIAYAMGAVFAGIGTLLLVLWVPFAKEFGLTDVAKDRIQFAFVCYAIALAGLLFGLYAMGILVLVMGGYLVYALIEGTRLFLRSLKNG